ncbi:hypothetical protein JCM33374_g3096 [Metschnikowia sp. JCM 33374]|nr:hypothetical protein JCM33374_g3096 [Metschnikowia sp. JCM 33374]
MAKQRGRRQNNVYKERSAEQTSNTGDAGPSHQTQENDGEESHENNEQTPKTQFESVFYGLVDSGEIDYFKQAESTLNVNAFDSDEERAGFIRSVLEESRGKELKLVTNQICSKLMERLVLYASDRQLKHIFHQFQGHFPALAHHKYSSHVLETLLVRSAALIEKELAQDARDDAEDLDDESADISEEDKFIQATTMESMFIKMLASFSPHWATMIIHPYASHVMRIVLLVTSAKELPSTTMANSVLRSKKSKIARKMIEIKDTDAFNRAYEVPPSFKNELKQIVAAVAAPLDTKAARELAIHKVASPVLQLILRVEGIFDRDRPVWHLLFGKEKDDKDSKEEAFVEYLLSDSVGSHFLEAIIKNDGARMKYIERLYKLYMKDRVLKLAKRATTGVYIVQALLLKLKPGEVEYILDEIVPEISSLISISENQNIDLGKAVIEASMSRFNYRRDDLVQQLFKKFAPNYDLEDPSDDTTTEFFENVLQLTGSTLGNTRDDWPTAEERRRALFIEKLMEYDYAFVVCAWLNFMALSPEKFMQMCFHGVFSHVVEHALVVKPASEGEPKDIMIRRKKFLNIFSGRIYELACNSYGSHIVDKLWEFTVLLPMYKDRVGSELMANSHKVKDSTYGRLVWKNWSMELFVRKKYDWKTLVKTQEQEYYATASADNADAAPETKKKPIELKMEQLFKQKQYQEEREKRKGEDLAYSEKKKQRMRGRDRY